MKQTLIKLRLHPNFLLASSMKNAREIIEKKEANGEIFNKEEKNKEN